MTETPHAKLATILTTTNEHVEAIAAPHRQAINDAQATVADERNTAKLAVRQEIRDAIIANLDETYELVYVDYRDSLDDDDAEAIVSGRTDEMFESRWEWESDSRYESARYEIEENQLPDLIRTWGEDDDEDYSTLVEDCDFKHSDEWDEIRFAIEDRDRSDWPKQLASNTGTVLLRITAIDEDHAFSYEVVKPRKLLTMLGIKHTKKNVDEAKEIIANASPEFGHAMGCWLASVNLADVYELPYNADTITITNPGFWLGNMWQGDGYAGQFEGTVTVKREDLHTDKGNWGYGWQDVAGYYPSAYPAEIKLATTNDVEIASTTED